MVVVEMISAILVILWKLIAVAFGWNVRCENEVAYSEIRGTSREKSLVSNVAWFVEKVVGYKCCGAEWEKS